MVLTGFAMVLAAGGQGPDPSQVPNWVPAEIRAAPEFLLSYISVGRPPTYVEFKRVADGVTIRLQAGTSSPEYASRPIITNARISPRVEVPQSGIPLARQCLIVSTPGHYNIEAVNNYEMVTTMMWTPLVTEGRSRKNRQDDLSVDGEWLEGIARKAMAKFAENRISRSGTLLIAGRSVPTVTMAKTGVRLVDLGGWAQARGVAVAQGGGGARFSFNWQGVQWVGALGTDRIKSGSQWRTMPDLAILHQGETWVPFDSLP